MSFSTQLAIAGTSGSNIATTSSGNPETADDDKCYDSESFIGLYSNVNSDSPEGVSSSSGHQVLRYLYCRQRNANALVLRTLALGLMSTKY